MTAVAASDFEDVDAEVHLEIEFEAREELQKEAREESQREAHEEVGAVDDSLIELTVWAGSDDPSDDRTVEGAEGLPDGDALPAMGAMSDEELLEGIRSQSEVHFAELYKRYFPRIYSFVYSRMRNHAETEEVVQETFLAVFRSFERYRGQSSLLSWIYGIAKNTANNSIRRSISQSERIDLADEEDLAPRSSLGVGTPGEQLDLHRFQDQLTLRLEGLADWQAEIFEMRHFENLSIPEISRRTARSSDAVRSSLYRVKRIFFEAAQSTGACAVMVGEQS